MLQTPIRSSAQHRSTNRNGKPDANRNKNVREARDTRFEEVVQKGSVLKFTGLGCCDGALHARSNRGRIAADAEMNTETMHYYERRRLSPIAPPFQANYRKYPDGTVSRVRFLKPAQGSRLYPRRNQRAALSASNARGRLGEVRRKAGNMKAGHRLRIGALRRMRPALPHLVGEGSAEGAASGCTIVHMRIRTMRGHHETPSRSR
jgi:MerR family transcriptional regulator, copper efflux regulator